MKAIDVSSWSQSLLRIVKTSFLYFALAFAAGFALGPVRMFILTPRVGPVWAVLIEMPFILSASYVIARWVMGRYATDASGVRRFAIGISALIMLMMAEMLLSLSMGIGPRAFAASLSTPAGAIGLAGQILFGFIPIVIGPATSGIATPSSPGSGDFTEETS